MANSLTSVLNSIRDERIDYQAFPILDAEKKLIDEIYSLLFNAIHADRFTSEELQELQLAAPDILYNLFDVIYGEKNYYENGELNIKQAVSDLIENRVRREGNHILRHERNGKQSKFIERTKQDFEVSGLYFDGIRNYAIIARENDYILAAGYDTSTGEWAQGYYDFPTFYSAQSYLRDGYPNAHQFRFPEIHGAESPDDDHVLLSHIVAGNRQEIFYGKRENYNPNTFDYDCSDDSLILIKTRELDPEDDLDYEYSVTPEELANAKETLGKNELVQKTLQALHELGWERFYGATQIRSKFAISAIETEIDARDDTAMEELREPTLDTYSDAELEAALKYDYILLTDYAEKLAAIHKERLVVEALFEVDDKNELRSLDEGHYQVNAVVRKTGLSANEVRRIVLDYSGKVTEEGKIIGNEQFNDYAYIPRNKQMEAFSTVNRAQLESVFQHDYFVDIRRDRENLEENNRINAQLKTMIAKDRNSYCSKALSKALEESTNGNIKTEVVNALIKEHGLDRIVHVVAGTIQYREWDKRFSEAVKGWAKENVGEVALLEKYKLNTHPSLLTGFVKELRDLQEDHETLNRLANDGFDSYYQSVKGGEHRPASYLGMVQSLGADREILRFITEGADGEHSLEGVYGQFHELIDSDYASTLIEEYGGEVKGTEFYHGNLINGEIHGVEKLRAGLERLENHINGLQAWAAERLEAGEIAGQNFKEIPKPVDEQQKDAPRELTEEERNNLYSRNDTEADIRCSRALSQALEESAEGILNPEQLNDFVKEFGFERIVHVTAGTIESKGWDSRFPDTIKKWAGENIGDVGFPAVYGLKAHPSIITRFAQQLGGMQAERLATSEEVVQSADSAEERGIYTVEIPVSTRQERRARATIFVMPQGSGQEGHTYALPNSLLKEDGEIITLTLPKEFTVTVKDAEKKSEDLSAKDFAEALEKAAVQQQFSEAEAVGEDSVKTDDPAEKKWESVSLPSAAKIKRYEDATLFKMPNGGEYEDRFFYIPNGFIKNEDGKSIRLNIPDDYKFQLRLKGKVEKEIDRATFLNAVQRAQENDYHNREELVRPSEAAIEALRARLGNVPKEMYENENWVGVRLTTDKNGNVYEQMVDCNTGGIAKETDPSTWTTGNLALLYAYSEGLDGLAYALTGKDNIVCIEFKNCWEEDADSNYKTDAVDIVVHAGMETYAENSADGKSLHIFGKISDPEFKSISKDGEKGFYRNARFIPITGNKSYLSLGSSVENIDNENLRKYLSDNFEKREEWKNPGMGIAGIVRREDAAVLSKAFKSKSGEQLKALYEGQEKKSYSDQALMRNLQYWCKGDMDQMLRIFATSKLYDPNIEREHYETLAQRAVENAAKKESQSSSASSKKPSSKGNGKNNSK